MPAVPRETSPDSGWPLPYRRAWNIAWRTAHIAVSGVLVGGHVFGQTPQLLLPWLYATVVTGAVLIGLESGPYLRWFHQGRGILVLVKLLLLSLVPWCWDQRVPLLFVVIVLASVGSHMPARFRYYSILYRRVLECSPRPRERASEAAGKDL